MRKFDVAVIGGGPGGYVAAIRAAQKGLSVALVEAGDLGGTCLNRGCIPTKAWLANVEVLKKVREAADFGIITGEISFDFSRMVKRTGSIVSRVRKGLEGLIASNKIVVIQGYGKLLAANEIKVTGKDNEVFHAENIILATGSEPREIPAFPFDHERIRCSTSILGLKELPNKLVVVGGGVIGCEFASLYHDLGVEVVILEMLPKLIMNEGEKISGALSAAFKKRGIEIRTEVAVQAIERTDDGVSVKLAGGDTIFADMSLVAVGRKFNTDNLGLEKAGVVVRDNGTIPIDEHMRTNVAGIYAIGDITGKFLLAHVASHQGLVAADNILGKKSRLHYKAVPSVIFTRPEIGTVGMTLEKALAEGYAAIVSAFPFQVLGKSQASLETEGFVQIVSDKSTGQILGAQVVGHEASTLIAEMTLAINNELTVDCVIETIHAHPTVAEAWLEAALIAEDVPLHFPPRKKTKAQVRKNQHVEARTV